MYLKKDLREADKDSSESLSLKDVDLRVSIISDQRGIEGPDKTKFGEMSLRL